MAKLKQKFEVATINNINITIDMSFFEETNEPYFNATDMAKAFEKQVKFWLRNQETSDYIDAIYRAYPEFKGDSHSPLNHQNLIKIKKGKYGGTYLHKRLAIHFARWCSPDLAVALDDFIIAMIEEYRKRKLAQQEALTGFIPLTDAIQESKNDPKHYHYSNEINMHYLIVTGKQAKQLCADMGLPEKTNVMKHLPSDQVKIISILRRMDETLIRLGLDYAERKKKLTEYFLKEQNNGLINKV